jgi:glycosyltransferase involved in cell wall biosynthesis
MVARASLLSPRPNRGGAEAADRIGAACADRCTPNPVDVPAEAPPLDGAPRAAFAGRLSVEKNLFLLLDAWRGVVAEIPQAHLTLFGEGGSFRSIEDELRRRVYSDPVLKQSVSLPGWVDDSASALAGSDVFVLPSSEEGMSNALLEACALGRVIVASDIPSNRSVLGGDYPFLVPPTNPTAFRSALLTAFNGSPLRENARFKVLEQVVPFSTPSIVERLEERLVAASRARS